MSEPGTAARIAADLAELIYGEYAAAGERLPSQPAVAAVYGVAPGTVADAWRRLARAGLAEVRSGRGTFVTPAEALACAPVMLALGAAAACRGAQAGQLAGLDPVLAGWIASRFRAAASEMLSGSTADPDLTAAARAVITSRDQPPLRACPDPGSRLGQVAARLFPGHGQVASKGASA